MPITETHEIHKRRFGRNLGVALTLLGFVAIVFLLTMSKIRNGGSVEAFDHSVRPSITQSEGESQ
ncbi:MULTISPECIES: hypothetical protein [Nioella]|jgi:hypothetical protein|uniref:hypothetical protein n=1 Tax=Nioella TaxID=1775424 RepID=UPI0008FD6A4D|nr:MULTISPECIES: hypothetical protein [Nioella]TBX29303.1 hypothetical protein TK43_00870 [Roseovarius sp. JS7-11]